MKKPIGKDYVIIHYSKDDNGFGIRNLENAMVRFGEHKVWIFENDVVYFKECTENISVNRSGSKLIVRTRNNKDTFIISKDTDIFDVIRMEEKIWN